MLKNVLGLMGTIVLVGCMGHEPTWVAEPLKTVEMPARVYITQSPEYRAPRFAQGTPLHLITGRMGIHGDPATAERFETFVKESGIRLEGIVMSSFEQALSENGPFEAVVPSGGDGQIQLVIADYGLERGWSFSESKPWLRLEARIFDQTGKMLWEEISEVNGFSEVSESRTLEGWLEDPDALRAAYRSAADRVSAELVAKMAEYRG
ncbi:MAG: hypothetical protein AAF493_02405 [Pseudomonadota bacterium]